LEEAVDLSSDRLLMNEREANNLTQRIFISIYIVKHSDYLSVFYHVHT
jgi:hypothetical protein